MSSTTPKFSTHVFKKADDGSVLSFDFYPPTSNTGKTPVILYFHGGGLVIGDSKSFFPVWLQERVSKLGYALISAEYRLLLPVATAHDILDDVKDAFSFIVNSPKVEHVVPGSDTRETFELDPTRIAVSGSSAGGWLAILAAAHCQDDPTFAPKAVVSIYGMGGDMFEKSIVKVQTEPFWFGMPLLELDKVKKYLYPLEPGVIEPSVGEAVVMSLEPPKGGRPMLVPLMIQVGNHLDYSTGQHEPSLSGTFRKIWEEETDPSKIRERLRDAVPEKHRALFPDFIIDQAKSWPPTLTIHGLADTIVPPEGSRNIAKLIKAKGGEVVTIELEGQTHGFDLAPTSEETFGKDYDQVVEFIQKWV